MVKNVRSQYHAAVGSGGILNKEQYAYADGSANHVRPTKITYPNGGFVRYEYNSGADDNLSRVSYLADDAGGGIGTHWADYTYLGLGMAVKVDYIEPAIWMDLASGMGDDPYDGLDRFDRARSNTSRQ